MKKSVLVLFAFAFFGQVNAQNLMDFQKVGSFTNQELRAELENTSQKNLPQSSVTGADVYEFTYFVEVEMGEMTKFSGQVVVPNGVNTKFPMVSFPPSNSTNFSNEDAWSTGLLMAGSGLVSVRALTQETGAEVSNSAVRAAVEVLNLNANVKLNGQMFVANESGTAPQMVSKQYIAENNLFNNSPSPEFYGKVIFK